ncbi:catalase HPII [Pollutimonas subterranea]|uniref:Catalase n=1 Tax=Pollutimonas subterranea TaxID=2045210 RepID=A0A2N4U5L7_9BURK|nr:catalase [Pollutimonas subterranea]PLC50318.1 catalase HPII [Pollutimonas subterranea]
MPTTPPPTGKNHPKQKSADSAYKNTDSGPALPPDPGNPDPAARKASDTAGMAKDMPFNPTKPNEHGHENALSPLRGATSPSATREALASTPSEKNQTAKYGDAAQPGVNAAGGSLNRVRADSAERMLTTNQGVTISDNQNSLKAGLRGPALLKDFILREKLTHFDHERIPERVVHARGSGAHGYFECYEPLTQYTRASIFAEKGKITPVFVRFSTVAGERGSKDTARDVRGFAVKFYTDEGNWDLVGNNMPVFFIQDAMKFPDLVHAVKPEPHHAMPQAASAHDTYWDFVSLMPESTHMLMWQMSDRAIPRSFRMMQGFGVHTFRFVNEAGESVFVKFHWDPKLGTHSLTWDEAVKISGADPDFNRRDLWEAIDAGEYPEWELGVQIFTEEEAEKYSFDVLDSTKIVPEELVPVQPVGRMVLNRNPDNFFAETEQVAFCAAHVVPGVDFSNDPLLAGRIHSYIDTQITRLGGPNFHELPINAPLAQVHNNQRDGMHRQAIHRGRVSYEPNSLGGGCPFQAGTAGFVSFPEPVQQDEVRGKPEKFAEHYNQARLFYESQTEFEQQHIADAFRFELSKVTVAAVRERVVSMLRNASEELAGKVAEGLGMPMPDAMPKALENPPAPEVNQSPRLSLMARPGDGGIRTRKVAIMIAPGTDGATAWAIANTLQAQGAVVRFVGPRIGPLATSDGDQIDADASLENQPAVLFDGVVLPDGAEAITMLSADGRAREFLQDQYRHCKTILALGGAAQLLSRSGIDVEAGQDPGLIVAAGDATEATQQFIQALAKHRHFERETQPPNV